MVKIQVSHIGGEKPTILISSIKELLTVFTEESFDEAFQVRTAVERLILNGGKPALSMNCAWRAHTTDSRRGKIKPIRKAGED